MAKTASRVLRTGGLWFDGVDDKVEFLFDMDYKNFTICFWFYLPYVFGSQSLFYGWPLTGMGYFLAETRYGKGILFVSRSSDTNEYINVGIDTGVSQVGKWNFACMVRNGTLLTAYFNTYVYTREDTRSGRSFRFRIGMGYETNWWGGRGTPRLIDEVSVYERALSADEVSEIRDRGTLIKDGLALYLPFYEGEGNIAHDVSGYGNHGTIYGGAMWVVKKSLRVLPKAR